nr:hypothetical protein [Clostridiales bacterium]
MPGVSLTTGDVGRDALAASFENGAAADAMRLWASWGIADDRWKHIPASTFASSAILCSADGDRRRFILSGNIGYLKVRFRGTDATACEPHAARQTTRSDYEQWDYIIGMDDENMWDMKRIYGGDPDGKLSMLLS